ncbi:triacylglycerol lipase [Protomyces lactucae-debilis]|uniref:Triacylglycerol lipase n=1 Tax=Protomyces lactucae-debilis TaxID=2754530 RepID=A0A1Y2FAJ8_PROLT|nr:triacylglycerol lipase [Protomyces lactucae-debilis]ORY80938.1 triacylglycerol lipase [Protomyces lactucae-debilis]
MTTRAYACCHRKTWRFVRRQTTLANQKTSDLTDDQRVQQFGKAWSSEFGSIRETYKSLKHPVVLCHGLLGFDTLYIGRNDTYHIPPLAVVHYWRGIKEALEHNGNTVFVPRVPRTATVEARARILSDQIKERFKDQPVNLIGHSMGGLDCRHLISSIREVNVLSLSTVATPHRGSPFADYCIDMIGGKVRLPRIYRVFEKLNMDIRAFEQLTTDYANKEFNIKNPDDPKVKYFSYGSYFQPNIFSAFRLPWKVIHDKEGPNDGLVSVYSSRWGEYQGTINDANHLDIINFTNRVEYYFMSLVQQEPNFNAVALYLGITHMLAKQGL